MQDHAVEPGARSIVPVWNDAGIVFDSNGLLANEVGNSIRVHVDVHGATQGRFVKSSESPSKDGRGKPGRPGDARAGRPREAAANPPRAAHGDIGHDPPKAHDDGRIEAVSGPRRISRRLS